MIASELKRTLQSLACAKWKVLSKFPKSRDVNETDSFSFNFSFTAPINKIKIQTIINKLESAEERQETDSKVDEGRKTQCDVSSPFSRFPLDLTNESNLDLDRQACIVRIMKDRKTLPMQSLINETIRQLAHRFTPSLPMVKQAIERLIDKEYLERNENDRKSLNYLVRPPPFFTLRNQRILIPSFSVAIGLKRVCVVLHSYPPSLLVTLLYIPPCPCRPSFSSSTAEPSQQFGLRGSSFFNLRSWLFF